MICSPPGVPGDTAAHYEHLLAPVYEWMCGGVEAALEAGEMELDALRLPQARGDLVLDLGAGFGAHAVPLARRGARVVAIDASPALLGRLEALRGGLSVVIVVDDLRRFRRHVDETPAAILCMGDTITHLPGFDAVEELVRDARDVLAAGGLFATSFRDYSRSPTGERRSIAVRRDDDRALTCVLEYEADSVLVRDILEERTGGDWRTTASQYRKARIAPDRLARCMRLNGFEVRRAEASAGLVRLVGRRGA